MMEKLDISDEELTAYLDGEHDFVNAADVDAALEHDALLRRRLDALVVDRDMIRNVFDQTLSKAPPAPDMSRTAKPSRSARNYAAGWQTAAAVLLLSFGAWGGYNFSKPEVLNWRENVAIYQSLYVADTLSQINNTDAENAEELARVMAKIGKEISLATLKSNPDLIYKRAQILGFDDRPLAQLAFLTNTGAPVALCIIKTDGAAQNVSYGKLHGLSSAQWAEDGFEYLLIGNLEADKMEKLATQFAL